MFCSLLGRGWSEFMPSDGLQGRFWVLIGMTLGRSEVVFTLLGVGFFAFFERSSVTLRSALVTRA